MAKKFYFAGSIRGGRVDADLYRRIIEYIQRNDVVLTEHVGKSNLSLTEQGRERDARIYDQDTAWLRESDVLIAECTCPSLGVGYELAYAEARGIPYIAEGSNLDDNGDYRPGLIAVAELGVKSPLRDAGLCKEEIRALSKELGLPTWNKQSFACLSSRFVYGETISEERLQMVDRAEQLLLDLGFHQVRVRIHGMMARIELHPSEFTRLLDTEVRAKITAEFRALGFRYITMDLEGYRTGSMNEGVV